MNEQDLQELIRFCEITHTNNIFTFVTVRGVQEQESLEDLIAKLPLLKTVNVAKYIGGMELIPSGQIYQFSEALQFVRVLNVYSAEALGANPDIQKVTFDLKYGQRLP